MKTKQCLYTLITGASTGLGKELAIECARRKMNLILVSLPGENLPELCFNLSENYQVSAFHYEADLTDMKQVERLTEWVVANFSVNVLINNAGIGGTRSFETTPTEYLDRLIQLNIRATTLITRLLIPELKMHRKAYILNVSSMAAFSPLPYKTVYPASKAFIYHFTRGLKAELRNTNIKVSVVNPGPIMTNADVTSRILKQGKLGQLALVSASSIARISVKNLIKGKAVIIPGFLNQINVFLMNLIPSGIKLSLSVRVVQRELQ
ncbi:MAG: SDR family NAD(P)-dependent oxidoreductase [Prolixibacteraceae bacterium]|nr:SDR family NAD(P)-dependent oxidoreductase [Prolixibacteraceae bacterium]